jgi:hypothetical protein
VGGRRGKTPACDEHMLLGAVVLHAAHTHLMPATVSAQRVARLVEKIGMVDAKDIMEPYFLLTNNGLEQSVRRSQPRNRLSSPPVR